MSEEVEDAVEGFSGLDIEDLLGSARAKPARTKRHGYTSGAVWISRPSVTATAYSLNDAKTISAGDLE